MRRWGVWGAIALLGLLLAGNIIATHDVLTAPYPGHNDFLSRWEGARSYWRDGLNPYGQAASANIQQRIYGRRAADDEDPGYFAYPFYTVFLLLPLVFTGYAWASAVWMVLLEACLVAATILLLDLYGWRPRPGLLGVLLLWTLGNYYAARGLLLGQPGLLVYGLHVLALWAFARRRDALAGAALALSTIKPQMGFLLIPFLLLVGLSLRRWRLLAAFAGAGGVLAGLSFALVPTWLGDWLAQIEQYPSYTALGAPVWIVTRHYLGLGAAVEWAANAALWALLAWAWAMVLWRGRGERLDWTVMLTLTVTHLSAMRTATPHFVVFTIPLLFYLRGLTLRQRSGTRLAAAILLALLAAPWVHFLLTVVDGFEHPTLYLPVPFGMLALLWLTRRQWWAADSVLLPREAV
ncbi:MAG: glycosyltransferase 87 family protein [Anaerolineae bacterium]|nr:glycosyltransferase 87 family protein [Anaerolineae bacterium]